MKGEGVLRNERVCLDQHQLVRSIFDGNEVHHFRIPHSILRHAVPRAAGLLRYDRRLAANFLNSSASLSVRLSICRSVSWRNSSASSALPKAHRPLESGTDSCVDNPSRSRVWSGREHEDAADPLSIKLLLDNYYGVTMPDLIRLIVR
jgi:hypothetical protein